MAIVNPRPLSTSKREFDKLPVADKLSVMRGPAKRHWEVEQIASETKDRLK